MRLIGERVKRVEDHRILTGRARYIEDLRLPRALQAAFVRSPMAHARILAIDVTAARAMPGVVAVMAWSDLSAVLQPFPLATLAGQPPSFGALADDRVRYVGDPVVMVLAESRREAEDGAEMVEVSYDPLPPVANFDAAIDPSAPRLFDDLDDNVLHRDEISVGDIDEVMAAADRVISLSFRQDRISPNPMETRGAVADYDPSLDEIVVHCNLQSPHACRIALGETMRMSMERVRVISVEDIGGAFGLKSTLGREIFCVAAGSRILGRPVRWIEDRYEHLLSSGQAREESMDVDIGVSNDGIFHGLRATVSQDLGAYPGVPFNGAFLTGSILPYFPGPYRWAAYSLKRTSVATNKATYVAYRGPWAIETWVRERFIDEVARELGLDPAEVRRRNMVLGEPDDAIITGPSLAGVSSRASLDRALELIGYEEFRTTQVAARAEGRCVGIGFATFIESAPGPRKDRERMGPFKGESASVQLQSDGHLLVTIAQAPHGQGHETTVAQIAAEEMGIPFDHVRVLHGDTRTMPFKLTGTGGSMASTYASGAVTMSTRKVREKVLAIASAMLEISPEDLEINDGVISPRGTPTTVLPLAQIAMQATMMPDSLPPGTDRLLSADERFTGEGITGSGWSGGTHACIVEIDLETGAVKILRYVVLEDCGRLINPAIVEGQIRGGVAQGIGEVLYEYAAYDDDGNYLASTYMDYLLPTASEIPEIEIEHMEIEQDGEFAFRGVGEGGTIVAPATLTNAIADALVPYGGLVRDQYLPPAKILRLAGVIDD